MVAKTLHLTIEFFFAGMCERRMADIVGQSQDFRQVLLQPQRDRNGARELSDLNRMGQTVSEVIVEARTEHLGFVFQAPECTRVDDSVAISREVVSVRMRKLRITASAAFAQRK